ncbi:MAG TPA: DNA-directed RNA polymerase subunit A' [archaeon]|nr:DNA-directed RNA polymerase subunit A' [archaeon]
MQIKSIDFNLLSPQMIKKIAVVELTKADLYDNDGFPLEGGIMDPRLGVIDPGLRCRTCGLTMDACMGHFGYIELIRPVVHVLYAKLIYKLLKIICSSCSKLISTSATTQIKKCPHCSAEQLPIKFEKPYGFLEGETQLTNLQVRERFEKISDEDVKLLGIMGGRPEWLLITVFPVPPVLVRPSITLETGERSEDDLTHKLVDIVRINQRLRDNISIGAPDFIIGDLWELLQYHVATYFDNELSGIPAARHRSGRPLKTLADRLKSKEGRFRHNLAGKRVNFSARSVISPEPSISINEVGVPLIIAKELTVPVVVHEKNIDYVKSLILNVPHWPCVNYIIRPDGKKKKVTAENKEEILQEVGVGYTIERQMQNGDIVLFNRQPSLHRMSIMAHKVRVTPWRTMTLNPAVCPPYNADFDGDEMNIHVPQTEEARAEAKMLMLVEKHIRSPRFGGPIIGCVKDHISGLYSLTRKENSVSAKNAFNMLANIGIIQEDLKDKVRGKDIFSATMPKDLSVEFKTKAWKDPCKKEECERDDYMVIRNGKLIAGSVDSKAVGKESGKLIDIIERLYGSEEAAKFIDRTAALGIKYLDLVGFSLSIDDFGLSDEANQKIKAVIEKGEADVERLIQIHKEGKIEVLAGMSAEKSLEANILKVLSKVSEDAGRIIEPSFRENAVLTMATSGAVGSMTHITQLSGLVGQARILGERAQRGYTGRTLAHFAVGDLSPLAHGFIKNSFRSGLHPFEFFFDAMSGRESLMDKGLRTRHSGYLERRLMNALQDLKLGYDGTIRDNRGIIIQFVPGEDFIDPAKADWGKLDLRAIVQTVVK